MTTALRQPIQIVCVHEIMVLRTCVSYRELTKCYSINKTISDSSEYMYVWVHTCMCIKTYAWHACLCAYHADSVYTYITHNDAYVCCICSCYISVVYYVLLIFVGLCISQMCLGYWTFSLLTIITSSFNLTLDPHLSFSWLHVYTYFSHQKWGFMILPQFLK